MKTILVVDDETAILAMLTTVLEDAGYRVLGAGDGHAALAHLAQAPADVVLSDVMMPRMDGRELCRQMQTDPVQRTIPLVLMSAGYPAINLDGCRYAALLKKPFDVDDLIRTVEGVLGEASGQS